jgi:hypothetical protein
VNKLIRQVFTGTIVLVGMSTIVLGQALEAKAFLLEEDFRYEIGTDGFLANSYFNRGWIIANSSYPSFPESPQMPNYDIYQAYASIFGWDLKDADVLSNNPYLSSGFLAGAFYEPDVTISAWAVSPVVALENGAELSFETRQLAYTRCSSFQAMAL